MLKFRIIYAFLLVLLGVLAVFTVFRPMVSGEEYTEVLKDQLLQAEDEWILQFTLFNHEGEPQKYAINILVDGKQYTDDFLILDNRQYIYIGHIPRDTVSNDNVRVAIYKEGEYVPFKQGTYYLK
ncbi:hypothetical protein ACFLVM_00715 [Chloroflexota bacterium]